MDQRELIERLFSPGSRVFIEYVDAQSKINNCSTLIESLEGIYLVLYAPVVNNVPLVFCESQELTLRRLDVQEQEAYVTNVFVIDMLEDKIPLLICSKPQKIEKTSLRRFSRFGVMIPFEYSVNGGISGLGRINDLSLSGCYALIDQDLQVNKGVVLNLSLSIPDEADLLLKGEVIRVDPLPDNGQIGLAVYYHDITGAKKEVIYNYLFQLQMSSDHFFVYRPDNDDY